MVKEEGFDVKYGLKKGLGGTKGNWVDPAIQKSSMRYKFSIFSESYYILGITHRSSKHVTVGNIFHKYPGLEVNDVIDNAVFGVDEDNLPDKSKGPSVSID